jgi:zinc D-Ala-D-Ala carboxypeptidase
MVLMKTEHGTMDGNKMARIAAVLVAISGLILWSYQTYALTERLALTEDHLASSTAVYTTLLSIKKEHITKLEKENEELFESLSAEEKKRRRLERLANRQEDKIDDLTKLTTLDPELLKKYSKIYFLSENYAPTSLQDIDPKYLVDTTRKMQVHGDVAPFLKKMLEDANEEGIPLRVASAYRSFDTQKDLKTGYRIIYGAGTANQFSAEQGYSEHQLGTTIDFTTPTIKGTEVSFELTTAFKWLTENAHRYGFVLSYPKNNGYYIYEPWHWRFVGEDLADDLHDDKKFFYQYDQRVIDEYLIKIFD